MSVDQLGIGTRLDMRGVWACMKHELAQMRGQGSGARRM